MGYYLQDVKKTDSNVIQTVIGCNIYFDKDVRLRLNGDLRLTKNQYNEDYTTDESRVILELQARF